MEEEFSILSTNEALVQRRTLNGGVKQKNEITEVSYTFIRSTYWRSIFCMVIFPRGAR